MIEKRWLVLSLMCLVHPAHAAERGYLGVSFGNLRTTEKGEQTGVIVEKVFAGMAAQQAGLKPGEIVTQINGVPVPDRKTAVALLAENAAGERIRLTIVDSTGGRFHQSYVFVTMGDHPTSEFAKIMTAKPIPLKRRSPPSTCLSSTKSRDRSCRANFGSEH